MSAATPLHSIFTAKMAEIDLAEPVAAADAAWRHAALDRRSVLVLASGGERRHMVRTTAACPAGVL